MTETRRTGKNLTVTLDGQTLNYVTSFTHFADPLTGSHQGAGMDEPRVIWRGTRESGTIDVESAGDDALQASLIADKMTYVVSLVLSDGDVSETASNVWVTGGWAVSRGSPVIRRFRFFTRHG